MPQPYGATVGKRVQAARVQRVHVKPVLPQLQFVNNLLLQDVAHVGAGGDPEAGEPLLGHRCTAHHVPALQHLHVQPGSPQIPGGDQPVMSAANNYNLLLLGHG